MFSVVDLCIVNDLLAENVEKNGANDAPLSHSSLTFERVRAGIT